MRHHGGDADRRRVNPVVIVLAWVLAAVLATVVASWAVVTIGGERRPGGGVLTQAEVAAALADQTPSSGTAAPGAKPETSPPADPAPEPTAAAGSETAAPVPAAQVPAGPAPAPTAGPSPASNVVARTWDVLGGAVGAQCRGGAVELLYATPLDGWTVEVKHAGPDRVEVELRRGEAETKVRAGCVDGVPQEQVEAKDR
jgi:hypothetical protein